jgi:hypothetical protein
MAYTGEVLNACGVIEIDFSETFVVAVSGSGPNVCGHLLLFAQKCGYYFHVAEWYGYPHYMTEEGYQRYLKEEGKTELRRRKVALPKPNDALVYLEGLLSRPWKWFVVPNNCVSFAEEVIKAGGGNWSSITNCPAIATSDSISERLESFYQRLESGIYDLYGVPR